MSVRSPHPHPASARASTPASETFLMSAQHIPPHTQDSSNHEFHHPPTKGAPAHPKLTCTKHREHPAVSRAYPPPCHTPKPHCQHTRAQKAKKYFLGEPPRDNNPPGYSPKDKLDRTINTELGRAEVTTTTEKTQELK